MSDTNQETQEKTEERYSNANLKLSSRIVNGFKFLLFPKSRLKLFYIKKKEKIPQKKSKIRRMLKSTFSIIGVIMILLMIFFAIFGPWIAPYSFIEAQGRYPINSLEPPSTLYPLGTTYAGQDILSRIIYGTRTSLVIAFLSVSISAIIGIILGMIAGYFGKWLDTIIMRAMDMILAFPGIIFALAFLSIIGSKIENIVIILGVIGIPYYSRLTRSSVVKIRELDYIAAAKVSGAQNWRIMFRHILPNSIQPIIISMSFDIGRLIISVVTLAFLGFSDYQSINLGTDVYLARVHIYDAPWTLFWPSFMISISVIGFMIVGDGLRDVLDPRYQI